MKKVLIISYFFPPCNLPASQRAYGWAKYLKEFGYYPIIITRDWSIPIKEYADISKSSGTQIRHEKHNDYEVYYLPYKSNLRDRIFSKYGESKLRFVRKALTFYELLLQNFFLFPIPFKNLYSFSKEVLNNNPNIKTVIITANPFVQFKFGYLLSKKLKAKWVADYRDDWNTDELNKEKTRLEKLLSCLEAKKEKKWIATAEFITSISDYYSSKIAAFNNTQGHTIYNGYIKENNTTFNNKSTFTITHNGTLYPTQEIEVFCKGIIAAQEQLDCKMTLNFPGLQYNKSQALRVRNYLKDFNGELNITNRIKKEEVIKMQSNSHLLLMVSHKNIKGITSSKLFEYLSFKKPVLLCPSDNDVMEKILKESGLGTICNNQQEVCNYLVELWERITSNQAIIDSGDIFIEKYSRKNQTKELADLLKKI